MSVKANSNKSYKIGQTDYDQSTTKVYDIRKLDFGSLEHGENSNKYKAEFNIIDVVSTLFELRQALKTGGINDEEAGKVISAAIVRKETNNQDEEMQIMKTATLRQKFLSNNMKRSFVPRPSLEYLKYSNMDTVKDN